MNVPESDSLNQPDVLSRKAAREWAIKLQTAYNWAEVLEKLIFPIRKIQKRARGNQLVQGYWMTALGTQRTLPGSNCTNPELFTAFLGKIYDNTINYC